MSFPKVVIRPRRSMMLFAILAILMVMGSYIFVILLAAACVYTPYLLFSSTSYGNLQSLLLLLFGIAIAGGLLWSLLPRRDNFTPPGSLLERSSHPRLFEELEAIAGSLSEPMPSEVYLIGDVNAWVADRGGLMGFGSRRVMGLGLPLLSILTIPQFRAVLAHEFAHYYGGDTGLGPWVYKTKMAMIRTFQAVGTLGGLARNAILGIMHLIITQVLKGYFVLFLRAINLVSRRQEYRADELACLVVGPEHLIGGLRKIHGAAPAWQPYWNSEVVPVLNNGGVPALGDGFARFVAVPNISARIEEIVNKEIEEGKGTPYDTHPPLRRRIEAVRELPEISRAPDPRLADTLLNDPRATELRFLETLNPQLQPGSLSLVTWDEVAEKLTIPFWRSTAQQFAWVLEGVTAETLPSMMQKLPEMGAKIPDPKGMLLSPAQRMQRAGSLLAIGLALAMLTDGWQLHQQPGVFHLQRGSDEFNPFDAVEALINGTMTKAAYLNRCRELGISHLSLSTQKAPAM
jgi:Zn-dependent protease with chaperone function